MTTSASDLLDNAIPALFETSFSSPIGKLIAIADDEGLLMLEFSDGRGMQYEAKRLQQQATILPAASPILQSVEMQLKAYFAGKLKRFDLPLKPQGTPFQRRVWAQLQQIPYGQTISYADMAQVLGNRKVIRAAASANGANPISIVIPCHRVIGSDGELVGYGGGLHRKEWLINHERKYV